ncbi:phosphoserine phosphatase serb [Aureobasidium melanogenum CBS 110374]|uniref:phosphoserine phosphatase n=1 Tax=Aureobasidium melanogenum (strain CBS 110374) TaxID=1043003 RepID=A0A074W218_AURM1|nr:phosphoserine phosphatase serb [Aureobasidium melanogenum CBS 110374]KEQ66843.1 phosphoserine phosphatase serb [Aureobasidium melanogenum CBS 110374]
MDAEQWKNVAAFVTYTLQEELSIRRSLSAPRRFLDGPEDGQGCRVLEIAIPLPQKNPSPTLLECSAITRTASIVSLCQRHNIEVVLQPQALYVAHRTPGLAVFDMDSTLIQQEVIDELARAVGRYAQVSAITEAAMRGEAPYTDFEASLRARVGYLAGVHINIWQQLRAGVISFTPGARELIRVLRKLGWKTAVLSGGFTPLAEWVRQELGLDYCYANHLVEMDGQLTGELVEGMPIIHAEKKRELLSSIAEKEGIPLENVIAVGDGSNDLLMMHQAGLGIAFNAKPKVQLQAPTKINGSSLLDVAYILGCTVEEVTEILRQEMVLEGGQYVLKKLV